MKSARTKIVYVLPEFDLNTDSHFFHLYDLLDVANEKLDCQVIAERGWLSGGARSSRYHLQRWQWFPARVIELTSLLLWQRLRGRRWFYVHYSFVGALAAWFITGVLGGTVYYWNCGMPWLYRRPWLRERVFRFILRHTILVIGTPGMADQYRRHYGLHADRIRVVPNWIRTSRSVGGLTRDVARRRLGIPADRKVVLFVHRLSRRKGADRIPAIAVGVTKRVPDAMFLIVGDGPERKNLESRIMNHGLNVRLAGAVSNRSIFDYFAAADIFFMPSEEEGFPHVLLEAMASGLPYVANDVGGVKEITPLALADYIVPGDDTAKFCERLIRLLSLSPRERALLAEIEREWVQRYDIDTARARFVALFR